jgi:hypothetical protein
MVRQYKEGVNVIKRIRFFFLGLIIVIANIPTVAIANEDYEFPKVLNFSVTPKDIDLTANNPILTFTLEVSHSVGITSNQVNLNFFDASRTNQLSTRLIRTDNPINLALKKVTFKGSLLLPNSLTPNLYTFYAESITAQTGGSSTTPPQTGNIYPVKFNDFVDGETSVLVRSNGQLNLDFQTFVGPTFPSTLSASDNKPRNLFTSEPIWKVGETYKISDHFEKRTPLVDLSVLSNTPNVCSSNGVELKFVSTGNCSYTVFTAKTKDYVYKKLDLNATITEARQPEVITFADIPDQTSKDLPKTINVTSAYLSNGSLVLPTTSTPNICAPISLSSIRITSGGTCTLKYQASETGTHLASKLYTQSFEVARDTQTISFTPPATANLSAKTLALSATVPSGGVITYQTTSAGICSITGSTLNLLKGGNCAITATQAGTATLAPISATATVMIAGSVAPTKKTITCVKGKKTKKVSGTNPKCPKGYKVKR